MPYPEEHLLVHEQVWAAVLGTVLLVVTFGLLIAYSEGRRVWTRSTRNIGPTIARYARPLKGGSRTGTEDGQ